MRARAAPLINPAPVVHSRRAVRRARAPAPAADDNTREPFDALEVFGHLREISDPEHPYTLEQARPSALGGGVRRGVRPRRGLTRPPRASCA